MFLLPNMIKLYVVYNTLLSITINYKRFHIKIQNNSEQIKDQDQLKILTIEYNKTIKHLERLVIKGQRLLTLMQICRKYETQEEKVVPFVYCTKVENSLTSSSQQASILSNLDIMHQVI